MSRARRVLSVLLIVAVGACSSGKGSTAPATTGADGTDVSTSGTFAGLAPDQPIPADTDVSTGALTNGLRYFVRKNTSPGGRAELRLVVNAGSSLEESDQSGVAHFLEHMLFNGTEKYAGNELVKVLESFGSQFGADINAYTTYDETVYELSVATADPSVFDEALGILEQWLSHATLADTDVTNERGVVLDEWRQSQQASSGRVADAISELFLTGTPYEDRDPIGTDTAINAMTSEKVRRFYDEWYRPDNAAIVIVGDVDPDAVVKQVRDTFESATARGADTERPVLALDPYAKPAAAVHLDPDEATSLVELTLPTPAASQQTPTDLRDTTALGLAFQMIANRLSDDATRGDAPFTSASVDSNDLVRAIDAPSILLESTGENTTKALDALLTEFSRVDQHGFDDIEFARARDAFQSQVESQYDGRDTVQDTDWAATYVDAFLTGAPYPDAQTSHDLASAILQDLTPADVADAFAARRKVSAPHLLVVGPEDATAPTEADAVALIDEVARRTLEPRKTADTSGLQIMTAPDPVKETSSEEMKSEAGIYLTPTLLTFPNGVRVVLNPTPIVKGTIALGAASPGGLSLVPDADVASASLAQYVVASSGVGDLDQVQLEQVLADHTVQLTPYLDQTSEGFTGSSDTGDLETMLQLLHQYVVAPRVDQGAFDQTMNQLRAYVEDPTTDPDLAQQLALVEARYGDGADRFRPIPTQAEFDAITRESAERAWQDRFGDLHDLVIVLSGDLDVDTATDLARTYLGTLPSGDRTETWTDLQPDPPTGIVTREVKAGTGDRATLTVLSSATVTADSKDDLLARLLGNVVNSRLTDHLREALGESYSPNADISVSRQPDRLAEAYIQVTGAPDAMTKLSTVLHEDLAKLVADGPTADEFTAAMQELDNQLQLFSNEQLIDTLTSELLDGGAIDDLLGERDLAAKLTAADVQAFAATVFPADRYVEIIGLPAS